MQGTSQIAAEFAILTAGRMDLAAQCTRAIHRLRPWTPECFRALAQAFGFGIGATTLILLTKYRTLADLR
jgi:hypothetical protein